MNEDQIRHRWRTAVADREVQVTEAGRLFTDLVSMVADLRGANGCPWDREQSLASLRQYVIEEAQEVVEAIDTILAAEGDLRSNAKIAPADPTPPQGVDNARTPTKGLTIEHHPHRVDFNPSVSASGAPLPSKADRSSSKQLDNLYEKLSVELGDLALQVVFVNDILTAMGRGGADESLRHIQIKLIRRHPHVYSHGSAKNSAEVLAKWEQIKQSESSTELEI